MSRDEWFREYNTQVTANQSRELTGVAAYHLLAATEQVLAGIETSLEDDSDVRRRRINDKTVGSRWPRRGFTKATTSRLSRS